MNYGCKIRCTVNCLTAEERELDRIEREIQELQEKKLKILSKKSKDHAKDLINKANSICIDKLDGKTVIILS